MFQFKDCTELIAKGLLTVEEFTEWAKSNEVLNESFTNLVGPESEQEKRRHADTVYKMVHSAYASQGGIKGSGFNSPEDMVKNVHFWKLGHKDGKIHSVALYKDKNGRKRVAIATDGSDAGKKAISDVMRSDLHRDRAHMEVSGKSLSFLKKHVNVLDHAKTFDEAKKYHSDDEIRKPPEDDAEVKTHPELKDHFYQRKLGGHWHTKVLLGK